MAGISPSTSSGPYAANGVQTAFPFDFTANSAGEVAVEVDGYEISSSLYTVAVDGDYNGGTVTFLTAPANGASVLLLASPDFTQASDFESEGAYSLKTVNTINRRSAARDLWLKGQLDRTPIAPRDGAGGGLFPTPDGTGGWILTANGPGAAGPAGPTYLTLATFKAAAISNARQALKLPGTPNGEFYFETANAPYTADNVNIIKADSTALSVGAWVRSETALKSFPTAQGGTDNLGVKVQIGAVKSRLIVEGVDSTPQNDTNGYFAGVVSYLGRQPTADDIAVYSAVLGARNCYVIGGGYGGASGHDTLNVATAAWIGGAGSAVGNPFDIANNPVTKSGYCSFGWMKNGEIFGQTAAGFGELGKSNSRASFSITYQAQVEDTATLGAMALGPYIRVHNGDIANFDTKGPQGGFGAWQDIDRHGLLIGYGPNAGTRLKLTLEGAIEIGAGSVAGGIVVTRATSGDSYISRVYSRLGWRLMGDNGGTLNIEYGGLTSTLENSASGGTTSVTISGRDAGTVREFLKVKSNGDVLVSNVKVLGARDTGWTAMTGTGSKAALAAAAAGTASGTYVQAELQGALNRIAALEARLKSLDAAFVAHGLIGA